jgi:putative cardiolipin synthase
MKAGLRTPPSSSSWRAQAIRVAAALAFTVAQLVGCASLPPGSSYPRQPSVAYAHPEDSPIARHFAAAAGVHAGESGFRMLSRGMDGFAARIQLIDAAEHTLDLQYFIYHQDQSGRLITAAALRAADRGVRLRVLVDDGAVQPGDHRIRLLAGHPGVEVRVFNPFEYRGDSRVLRGLEFLFRHRRLDFRMHNKLMVVDNATALIGGRNIGDEYFQANPQQQYADDDVFVVGPTVQQLSAEFDLYWNSALAIPVEALSGGRPTQAQLAAYRAELSAVPSEAPDNRTSYLARAATGQPLQGILTGELPLVWAAAQVVCDPPDKQHPHKRGSAGPFNYEALARTVASATSELLMITPYFVPTPAETEILEALRRRGVRVGLLTNSLESTTEISAQSGYQRHRAEMLQAGVEIHELRAAPDSARGSGQSIRLSHYGKYGLHAKLYTIDRRQLFIGSMNLDQRSAWLNTEVGLIIDSPPLALQAVARYDAMTQLDSAYDVRLQPTATGGSRLVWQTRLGDRIVETTTEPSGNAWRRFEDDLLLLLPLDDEL